MVMPRRDAVPESPIVESEYDYSRYRLQVTRLSETLSELSRRASDNQRILEHFQAFELSLLASESLQQALDLLLVASLEHFSLDAVELIWLDHEGTTGEVMEDLPHSIEHLPLTLVPRPENVSRLYDGRARAQALGQAAIAARRLFTGRRDIQSALILPLVRGNQLVGSFHMGSRHASRFTADKALDFISHMASIIAVCLENAINQEHLRRLSVVDVLTRVKNRRGFDNSLEKEIARAWRSGEPLSLLFIDLDHFKSVNDLHGHPVGDSALKAVAGHIRTLLRKTDQLARYGGEEFAALLPACPAPRAAQIAERIRAEVGQLVMRNDQDQPFSVTLSIGLACWQPPESHAGIDGVGEALVRAADTAVYRAKAEGRNRVELEPL